MRWQQKSQLPSSINSIISGKYKIWTAGGSMSDSRGCNNHLKSLLMGENWSFIIIIIIIEYKRMILNITTRIRQRISERIIYSKARYFYYIMFLWITVILNIFIYSFWLHWLLVATCGIFIVVACGFFSLQLAGYLVVSCELLVEQCRI